MTPQALKDFRSRLPDCDLVVFADLGSRTVLGADGALRYPQEYLDALCDCAALLFDAAPQGTPEPADHVLFVGPTGARGFFRTAADPSEALCCLCRPDVDTRRLIDAARAALAGQGGAA